MAQQQPKASYREPLLRVAKRGDISGRKTFVWYIFAFIAAFLAGGIFILALGVNPIEFYSTIVTGCFKTNLSMVALVRIIVPLLITSLGVALAFKMKFWNIGAEGQFIMGAVFASWTGLFCSGLPHWLLMACMFLAGMIGGGLWGLIAAFFKCKFNTNETLLTLMLNYIALYIVQFLRDGPWRDPNAGGFPKISSFPENAWLDKVLGMDMSWIVGLVLVVLVFLYFNYTKQGYEISVVGDSQNTARYAGMNVKKVVMRTMFLSAALCGLAGMLQVSGDATSHTLSMGIASGVGFTAIIVAWLGRLNPFGILAISCMLGILEKGCGVTQSTFGLSASVSDILQGIILFFILGFDFFIRYRLVFRRPAKRKELSTVGNDH